MSKNIKFVKIMKDKKDALTICISFKAWKHNWWFATVTIKIRKRTWTEANRDKVEENEEDKKERWIR